jgi:hypothetical protein
MFSFTGRSVSSVAVLTLALTVPANADGGGVRLTTVAAEDGFTYQWMPTEGGAMLARPGVRIVIRAGRLFYEVNNATPISDTAPRFDGRDLVISAKLAEHLREIALKYPTPSDGPAAVISEQLATTPLAEYSGAALTLHARLIPGREAVALEGVGPAGVPVTITLTGEVSSDLPAVVLSRKTLTTANDGKFSAEVSYSQDAHPRTTLAATVSTSSGTSSAEARVVIGAVPSPQIKGSGLDDWPKK